MDRDWKVHTPPPQHTGWAKVRFPGSMNMRWKSCVLQPAAGRKTQLLIFIFTEPGNRTLAHPCTGSYGIPLSFQKVLHFHHAHSLLLHLNTKKTMPKINDSTISFADSILAWGSVTVLLNCLLEWSDCLRCLKVVYFIVSEWMSLDSGHSLSWGNFELISASVINLFLYPTSGEVYAYSYSHKLEGASIKYFRYIIGFMQGFLIY